MTKMEFHPKDIVAAVAISASSLLSRIPADQKISQEQIREAVAVALLVWAQSFDQSVEIIDELVAKGQATIPGDK